MVGGLKYENKRLRTRWYLSDSLYTTSLFLPRWGVTLLVRPRVNPDGYPSTRIYVLLRTLAVFDAAQGEQKEI